ncbi:MULTISPECIES: SEL1-like repeat protein [Sphingomonas]|uniref:SEL1-like repeat protein n=1 Tax=Sphingomonas kyungheensis TaxID=1069987 RepID=A0ABU8H5U8_9SPHN|nr:SEL1-like repeat protein [Sphingomonas sp. CV7422]
MGISSKSAQFLLDSRIADAMQGQPEALYDLGICYQTGTAGAGVDLIEAHKWFNLAAVAGFRDAAGARAEVAEDMTAREIALAQRQARDWLGMTRRAA